MRIAQAAQTCGLSTHTIRYYEKSGMLPEIARGVDGHRRFSAQNLDWLALIASLRETGMSMRTMKQFASLYSQGDATVIARKMMLCAHDKNLDLQQARLANCRSILIKKIARYDQITKGTQ